MVKELGHHIVDRLHEGVVIFPTAIVAAALISCSVTTWSTGSSKDHYDWDSSTKIVLCQHKMLCSFEGHCLPTFF